jgi:hypothetical protein
MSSRANTIFYTLSAFVLLTAVFVMTPSRVPEVSLLQTEIKTQFITAFQQTMGDQPYFDDVILVFDGVSAFYEEAATSAIALFEDREADAELAYIFQTTYKTLVATLGSYVSEEASANVAVSEPETPVTESGLYINPVPLRYEAAVSGSFVDNSPVNLEKPWVTIQDNYTSQLYCLAIYNGEVNKYLGPCQDDYR